MAFHDRAVDFDGSARSHTSPTPQSTSHRVDAGKLTGGLHGGYIFNSLTAIGAREHQLFNELLWCIVTRQIFICSQS